MTKSLRGAQHTSGWLAIASATVGIIVGLNHDYAFCFFLMVLALAASKISIALNRQLKTARHRRAAKFWADTHSQSFVKYQREVRKFK